jgi:hypothetical protein
MFPAPPLARGGDLNEIQAREESIKAAQVFQSQHAQSRINIDAFFALLNQEQNQPVVEEVEEIHHDEVEVVVASSVPVVDDAEVEEIAEPPKQKKQRGRGGKASAKTASSAEVVKKTSTDF